MAKNQQRAELAHWLHEARLAEREMASAREDAQKWLGRAKLAHQAGNAALVEEASNRARQERARFEKAKARHEETQREQQRLRARTPVISDQEARFADELLAMFQGMGIDPTESALDQLVEEEALKAKMVAMQEAAGVAAQADPLTLLRERMAARAAEAEAVSEAGAETAPAMTEPESAAEATSVEPEHATDATDVTASPAALAAAEAAHDSSTNADDAQDRGVPPVDGDGATKAADEG